VAVHEPEDGPSDVTSVCEPDMVREGDGRGFPYGEVVVTSGKRRGCTGVIVMEHVGA